MASLDLYTRASGDGPPITLLHGFTAHGGAWEALQRHLARHFRVLAIDLPGHGRSLAPPPHYDFAACIEDLIETMARRGHAPGAVVGYSMGGRLALALTARAPHLVTRLVLESASPGIAKPAERAARRAADAALADDIEAGDLASFIDRWQSQPLFRTQRRLDAAVLARARALRMENNGPALAAALRVLGTGTQPSYWDVLIQLRMPSLLVTGEKDEKFDRIAREMNTRLPSSRHSIVRDAGHTTHLENPTGFLACVEPFLAAVSDVDTRAAVAQ